MDMHQKIFFSPAECLHWNDTWHQNKKKLYLDDAERENEENKSIAETAGGDGAEWAAAETWLTGLNTTHNPSSLLFCFHFIGFNSDSVINKKNNNKNPKKQVRWDKTEKNYFFFS